MFKPVPVAIGLRYLRAKRRNGFISFISLASVLGIALGVTALILVGSILAKGGACWAAALIALTATAGLTGPAAIAEPAPPHFADGHGITVVGAAEDAVRGAERSNPIDS